MTRLLQEYLDLQAAQRPDRVAVVFDEERMTFAELAARSNRLAHLLVDGGCRPGDRVAFLLAKSPTAIATMLGILKADCVYVPLDPSSPAPRLARVIAASEPRWLITEEPQAKNLGQLLSMAPVRPRVGWVIGSPGPASDGVAFMPQDVAAQPDTTPRYRREAQDAAHILFTSGSTGEPKGVVITHAMVTAFVEWANGYLGTTPDDRTSGHSPLHFDLSTFDVFGSLAAGAELHLVPPALNLLAPKLAEFIRDSEITQWFSVPSILTYLARFGVIRQDDFPAMRHLLWCGEVFPTPPLIHWMRRLPHVTFTNLYGPTEATIASSYHTLPAIPASEGEAIPIGKPCAGEELLVLDDHDRPVHTGTHGHLHIAGVGLSPGYWRRDDLTDSAFVPHPTRPGQRMYRTGDIASIGADGLVYFHGRSDLQVKSRGYRIELGEIEAALGTIEGIEECAVVAIESRGFEGTTICCAYVASEDRELTPMVLKRVLGRLVPGYMLPTRWARYPLLPRNANGKTDRGSIRERFERET